MTDNDIFYALAEKNCPEEVRPILDLAHKYDDTKEGFSIMLLLAALAWDDNISKLMIRSLVPSLLPALMCLDAVTSQNAKRN